MKSFFLLIPVLLLFACGGGGSTKKPESPSLSIEKTSLTINANFESSIVQRISVDLKNMPSSGLLNKVDLQVIDSSIESVHFDRISKDKGSIYIKFIQGKDLPEGTFSNKVRLNLCLKLDADNKCIEHVKGSPIVVNTVWENHINNRGTVSLYSDSDSEIKLSGVVNKLEDFAHVVGVKVEDDKKASQLHYKILEDDEKDISSAKIRNAFIEKFQVVVDFSSAMNLPIGLHKSKTSIKVCYDHDCLHELNGSPLVFNASYKVDRFPDYINVIAPITRTEINHNIIDAEFNTFLDSIFMVSSKPENALYVFDTKDDSIEKIPLSYTPTSVSVHNSGGGSVVAIGHDTKITHINYNENDPSTSPVKVLTLPDEITSIIDLVVSDEQIFATAEVPPRVKLYSVDVNDNSTNVNRYTYGDGLKLQLSHNSKSLYVATNQSLRRVDVETFQSTSPIDSPQRDSACGNLWVNSVSSRVYTACGNAYALSDITSEDMLYIDSLRSSLHSQLLSISEAPTANRLVYIEKDNSDSSCRLSSNKDTCIYSLNYNNKNGFIFNPETEQSFNGIFVNNEFYYEKPEFVFYNNSGSNVFILSKLLDTPTDKNYILKID